MRAVRRCNSIFVTLSRIMHQHMMHTSCIIPLGAPSIDHQTRSFFSQAFICPQLIMLFEIEVIPSCFTYNVRKSAICSLHIPPIYYTIYILCAIDAIVVYCIETCAAHYPARKPERWRCGMIRDRIDLKRDCLNTGEISTSWFARHKVRDWPSGIWGATLPRVH